MLELKSISKSFQEDFWKKPSLVLKDVSFTIAPQSITGFVGKNGSGKSTTIKIILGLLKQDEGKVHFQKGLGQNRKEILNNIGYLPESPRFFENLTGRKFLNYMGGFHHLDRISIESRIEEISSKFEMSEYLDRKIGKYSKGMRQKIGFISSVIHNPKLVILDEPLSGLDPVARSLFKEYFKEIRERGSSILMTSHILEDLFEVSDEIIKIDQGEVTNSVFEKNIKMTIKNNYPNLNRQCAISITEKGDCLSIILKEHEREAFLLKNNIQLLDIIHIGDSVSFVLD